MTQGWHVSMINPETGEVSLKNVSGETISAIIPPEHVSSKDKMAYLESVTAHRDAAKVKTTENNQKQVENNQKQVVLVKESLLTKLFSNVLLIIRMIISSLKWL